MTVEELEKKQKEMHETIYNHAHSLGLIKQKPFLEPIYDGVSDIQGYLSSSPKIMWILKEPYNEFTASGNPKGGAWSFTDHFKNQDVWQDEDMWKLMIQINFAIRNNLKWKELDFIADNPKMAEELKKTAYINLSKMPGPTVSPDEHLWECYNNWKEIILEQIKLYSPNIIIFGYTFKFLKEDLQIADKPIPTVSGQWNTDAYKKDGIIFIDAYHPSRKGGENGSHDYVTSIINAVKKLL